MQNNKLVLVIIFLAIFIAGIAVGINIQSRRSQTEPVSLNPIPDTCEFNGKSYRPGESFPAEDGCNTCSCNPQGEVLCTTMGC